MPETTNEKPVDAFIRANPAAAAQVYIFALMSAVADSAEKEEARDCAVAAVAAWAEDMVAEGWAA